MSDVRAVALLLQATPAVASDVLDNRELLPSTPGFYGWWSRQGAIGGVPHVAHPRQGELSLLYVGISPVREGSRQTIRSRVIGNHLKGNVGSSTFRFTLAALLTDALALDPFMRGSKVTLDAADNARLSVWQREHLLLTWCATPRPWEIEREVIAELGPPLNSADNAAHAFHAHVRGARAQFRRRAAARAASAHGASRLAVDRPFSADVSFSQSGREPKPPGRS
jgi:hypothetical protein